MERIAVTAGVDKALPYRYFTNAHSVLVEIYQEYSFILAARVSTAVTEAATIEEKVDAAVGAYLDVIAEHRIMLGLLALSRTAVPTETEEALRANDFVVELFVGQFGVPRPIAAMTADVVVTLLEGTARAWARNPERRDFLQRLAVAAILATVSEAVQVS